MTKEESPDRSGKSAAAVVAAGILASRLIGFAREMVVALCFGVGPHADVLRTALRLPNVLQNLLGEGSVSASFIPVYSRMLREGRAEEAGRFAGAIFGLLLALVSAAVLLGMALAPWLVAVLAYGFVGDAGADLPAGVGWLADTLGGLSSGPGEGAAIDRYSLAVQAVRIVFPMTGVLVLSAWALGVLNSHRRFLLPYLAPVLWNAAIIIALLLGAYFLGGSLIPGDGMDTAARTDLLFIAFWGALAGGLLQFLVQVPLAGRLLRGFRLSFSRQVEGVSDAIRAFGPVVAGRGVAQLSSYLDLFLATLLAAGAVSALGFAQVLYLLPISLFAMSVAAAELPELSRLGAGRQAELVDRLGPSLCQILFLTVPTVIGYLAFGLLIVRVLFEHGAFGRNDSWLVYAVLAAYSLGLAATTVSRLLQNVFWAVGDTRTPARLVVIRVLLSTAAAVPLMYWLDSFGVAASLGLPAGLVSANSLYFGAVGLGLGASLGAWVELAGLLLALRRRLPGFRMPGPRVLALTAAALLAAPPAGMLWWLLPPWPALALTIPVLGLYAAIYLGTAWLRGAPELQRWTGRLQRRTKP